MENGEVSDNEQDEIMEDADQDQEQEDDDDDDQDQEEEADEDGGDDQNEDPEEDEQENEDDSQHPEPVRSRSTTQPPVRPLPTLRPGADTCSTYDIVPYVAAPQSTSINAVCATPCMRWLFTGGSDGYIRRYDWFGSINGKVPLTVAQRHPFVDSVTRAGQLLSYWENEETAVKSEYLHVPETTDDLKLSPVYSLAVQNQSIWLLSGLESGTINLQSVRHDEGKIITTLRKHTSAVSVLTLSADERTLLSGSWDKCLYDWDLNTGVSTRDYTGSAGQLSSISFRPYSPAREEIKRVPLMNGVSDNGGGRTVINGTNGVPPVEGEQEQDAPGSPAESNFGSLFGDDDDMGMGGEDDAMNQAIVNGLDGGNGPSATDDNGDSVDTAMGEAVSNGKPPEEKDQRNGEASHSTSTNGVQPMNETSSFASYASNNESSTHLPGSTASDDSSTDQNIFLSSSMDGSLRIWDRRQAAPVAISIPARGVPPWCMQACWSTDGNWIYAGRRNGTVEEYSVHKGIHESTRTLKFPNPSGPVSAVYPMPNGRNLMCASFDNLRLYDLKHVQTKQSTVPFLIIPGHHGGVISQIYADPTCTFMITIGGNRGWEGSNTEVLLGYEIGIPR